jgi:anaerobic magnesium-protoporphyrin IX monomethyl ester cyclase
VHAPDRTGPGDLTGRGLLPRARRLGSSPIDGPWIGIGIAEAPSVTSSVKPRVLLLVPPARDVVIRDYYCSKTSQANYLHPPIDLAIQGGWLRQHGFEPVLIDATVDQLTPAVALERILEAAPVAIFALAGAVSWATDAPFLREVHERTGAPVYASGDLFMEDAGAALANAPYLAGVLTDFTSDELARRLAGETFDRDALVLADDEPHAFRRTRGARPIPLPAHDLFLGHDYRYAFARGLPIAGIYVGYGCPYTCSFCITGELGSSVRPVDNVMAELRALRDLGVRELFVQDQCFGQPRAPFEALLDAMIAEDLGLGWWTFTRVDVLDRELARKMKAAGCHTVILGVESASREILDKHRKGYGPDLVRECFDLAESEGLRTAATFILGLPEETAETIQATIDFACSLPADYASFNVAVPRAGTRLRKSAVKDGLVDAGLVIMDQSGFEPTLPTRGLTAEDLRRWRRRAVRSFYLRPSYLWRRFRHLRSASEARTQAREAWALLRNLALR